MKGDEVVGTFGLERARTCRWNCAACMLTPRRAGSGIAWQMLQFVEDECRRRSVSRLELSTAEIQMAALALYRSAGYRLVRIDIADELTNETVGSGLRRHFFEKYL